MEADAAAAAAAAGLDDEFATLKCGPEDAAATVHLRLRFGDGGNDRQDAVVMRAVAVIVAGGTDARSGVYDGCVLRRQAVASGKRRLQAAGTRATDDGESLSSWYRDARAALIGSGDGDVEYAYSLTRSDDDGTAPPSLELSWKLKLRLFGKVPAGYVCLSRVQDDGGRGLLGQVGALLIEPLIDGLRAERDRRLASDRDAAESCRRLAEDNRLLLDRLRSAADGRERDDVRLVARFAEVLNAKKRQLVLLRQQVTELRQRSPVAEMQPAVTTTKTVRRRGRPPTRVVSKVPAAKMKRPAAGRCVSSEEEERAVDDAEPMRVDGESGAAVVAAVNDVVMAASSAPPESFDVFAADTQIDDPPPAADLQQSSPDSPSWFPRQSNIQPPQSSVQPSQSSVQPPQSNVQSPQSEPDQSNSRPVKKNVFDDLWSGIL